MSGDMESFPFISLSLGRREMMGIMRLSIYLMARMRLLAQSSNVLNLTKREVLRQILDIHLGSEEPP